MMIFFGLVFQVCRNFSDFNRRICRIACINNRVHIQQIDNADEIGFRTDRELQSQRRCTQTILDHVQTTVEVGADAIHFVAENK